MPTSNRARISLLFSLLLPLGAFAACAGPEQCRACIVSDAGPPIGEGGGPGGGGTAGMGGTSATGGGGAGGEETGGQGAGGAGAVGGLGGEAASGGSGPGGAAGGAGAGGQGSGSGTGGAATGGSGTGGAGTGGSATGGSGTGGRGAGTGGNGVGGTTATDPDLVLWYKFDDGSGVNAVDAAMSGGVARNGTLTTIGSGGSATFSTSKQVGTHAVSLVPAATGANANGGFVTAPALHTLAPAAMTIAVWVNLTANGTAQSWARVFDFGSGTGTEPNMYLTTRASNAPNTPVRFAITTTGHAGTAEQRLDGPSTLTANAWHHIAVVLPAGSPFTGTLYIDGVPVATNPAMTLHAGDLGATVNNWLGRSQFSLMQGTNPCFNGLLDDFRVYKRALTVGEIAALQAVR